ncbi:uncharacterized protein PAC_04999 [Phialocephala subalpina]|uniref:RBR-type E3 ubiquitin transferase n=1 Tax=Phialocephala subalpina TaxID=576137 RepID=A0A1L7WQS3_9HELO|nr:uncharacterized protein PAC_04999 [Phialocephala subalpina]
MAMNAAVGSLAEVDDATAALLLQLQIEDLDELIKNLPVKGKGKRREGTISDAELAFQLGKEELQRNATILSDRQMTKSIARAVMADAQALTFAATQERSEATDRAIALREFRLEGGNVPLVLPAPPAAALLPIDNNNSDNEFIDKLSALYVETPVEVPESSTALVKYDPRANVAAALTTATGALVVYNPDIDISNAESSGQAATRQAIKIDKRECIICLDIVVFFEVAKLPCGHECCRSCLVDMFTSSLVDESRYPPKCCDGIPPDAKEVRLFLSADIIKEFEEKKIEWETKDRTYCSNLECGKFIRLENITHGLATCPTCKTVTCTLCGEGAHDTGCPKDEALQQVLQLMEEKGWRRCYSCKAGVELNFGCNHITFVHSLCVSDHVLMDLVVNVEPSSAMCAQLAGRIATAPSGMKIDSSTMPRKLLIVKAWRWMRLLIDFYNRQIAIIQQIVGSGSLEIARSVMTSCIASSWNALTASLGDADAVWPLTRRW